jgi:uncharacterized membrane protein HdeD (DUF308 family)
MFVLSYRVGSLYTVAAFVGVTFLFGGVSQLAVASRVQGWRWLFVVAGILPLITGIITFACQRSRCTSCRSSWPGT